MLSIHFDGPMTERPANNIKGKIFVANRGDLVYSKIDLRNGAIGIVPDKYDAVGFTSEFPIYDVCEDQVDREYIKLVLHSEKFRQYVHGLVSGTSGRKRIDPESLESISIPVPPLPIQREIVNFWENAQKKAGELVAQAEQIESEIEDNIISVIDTPNHVLQRKSGAFLVSSKEIDRWDVGYHAYCQAQTSLQNSIPLKEQIEEIDRQRIVPSNKEKYLYIGLESIEKGTGKYSPKEVVNGEIKGTSIVLKDGYIYYAKLRPYLNKVILFEGSGKKSSLAQSYMVLD